MMQPEFISDNYGANIYISLNILYFLLRKCKNINVN